MGAKPHLIAPIVTSIEKYLEVTRESQLKIERATCVSQAIYRLRTPAPCSCLLCLHIVPAQDLSHNTIL